MKYRKVTYLTDDEIQFILSNIFSTISIESITRIDMENKIECECKITFDVEEDGYIMTLVSDVDIVLKEPTIYNSGLETYSCDIETTSDLTDEEKLKWRQFCAANGINVLLKDNPYIKE